MRLVLQRPLTRSSAVCVLRDAVHSNGAGFCQHTSHSTSTQGQSERYAAQEVRRDQHPASKARALKIRKIPGLIRKHPAYLRDEIFGKGAINWHDTRKAHAPLPNAPKFEGVDGAGASPSTVGPEFKKVQGTQHDPHSGNLSSGVQSLLPINTNESWRSQLVTLEQYQYESDIEAPASQGSRLVDDPSHTQDWQLWLELILFRKRHYRAVGTIAMYKEIFRRGLRLPTQGIVADQLWGLLMRAGVYDPRFLEEVFTYAIRLKESTTGSWSGLYYGIVSIALKTDPDSAHEWHLKLKDDFPPSLQDYKIMFKMSLEWDSCAHFQSLYRDTPLFGMYRTVIRLLCQSQMYAEALKWHDILIGARDFPTRYSDLKPLLHHLAYTGDGLRLESIVTELAEARVGVLNSTEIFVQREKAISREILNRQLGEVHGVDPKHLSDSFCARLFATRLFSVDTVISGLQMMGTEAIGPLSYREIADRDNCEPGAIRRHSDGLEKAGISLGGSVFCALVRRLAVEDKGKVLESVVNCDLHPDTFADFDLQERLLAEYYEKGDLMKIERTLAILTTNCSMENLQMVQMNLILRCQVTLWRTEKVLATLGEMKQKGIPVSARSSRHLRVCWLSRRQVGRGARETHELATLIQASQMTMQTGGYVPIIAWREILRRLGMAGRLLEFENLALWLVDWYSSPAAKAALPKRTLLAGHVSPLKPLKRGPPHILNTLFTTAARHAIVAWGFQHVFSSRANIIRFGKVSTVRYPPRAHSMLRFPWTWGLHLLYKLRERGLFIAKSEVAQICRHRLRILFGKGGSKRRINRRARSATSALVSHPESVYIRKMEEIWGKGLFQGSRHAHLERHIREKSQKVWRWNFS